MDTHTYTPHTFKVKVHWIKMRPSIPIRRLKVISDRFPVVNEIWTKKLKENMTSVSESFLLSTFGYESIMFSPCFFQHAANTLSVDHAQWDLGHRKCPPLSAARSSGATGYMNCPDVPAKAACARRGDCAPHKHLGSGSNSCIVFFLEKKL